MATIDSYQNAIDEIMGCGNGKSLDYLSLEQINKIANLIPEKYIYQLVRECNIINPERYHHLNVIMNVSKIDQEKSIKYLAMTEKGIRPNDMHPDFWKWFMRLNMSNKKIFINQSSINYRQCQKL